MVDQWMQCTFVKGKVCSDAPYFGKKTIKRFSIDSPNTKILTDTGDLNEIHFHSDGPWKYAAHMLKSQNRYLRESKAARVSLVADKLWKSQREPRKQESQRVDTIEAIVRRLASDPLDITNASYQRDWPDTDGDEDDPCEPIVRRSKRRRK